NRKYCHVSKSNLSSNSEVKEQKNSLNIAFHPRNSKGISSPNPSTSSNLTFDNTSTNNAIENYNKELVQMHSEDDANSSPTSPAVFSRQQIDENQKENVKMLCSTLGVIKENLGPEYFEAGENRVYENKLPNYTAKGKRSRPSIDGKLLKALFKKINEPRSCQEQVPEHVFIHFINHSIVNKRNYEENKNMDDNKAAKKLKKSTTEPKKAPNTKKNTVD
ncbi:hypothetical protein PV325_010118, partial [Microctonus aethiopoides]